MTNQTIKEKIKASILNSEPNVFLRKDFEIFGGYDQVGRALKSVIVEGLLVKAGYGLYVKAEKSILNGAPIPTIPIDQIGLEALSKLGVEADLGKAARENAEGKTTQIPVAYVVNIGKRRISRKIGFNGKQVRFEND